MFIIILLLFILVYNVRARFNYECVLLLFLVCIHYREISIYSDGNMNEVASYRRWLLSVEHHLPDEGLALKRCQLMRLFLQVRQCAGVSSTDRSDSSTQSE